MAAINCRHLVLQDKWPGIPNINLSVPTGGFDSTRWNDITTEAYPIGTKIQVYGDSSGCKGPYTMIYLRYYCLSGNNAVEDITSDYAIFQQFCNSTCASADGTTAIFTCTNCGGIDTGYKCGSAVGIVAVACATLSDHDVTTDGNNGGGYGWFWCGGPCPAEDITFFDVCAGKGADMTTAGGVVAGTEIHYEVDTSVGVFDGGDPSSNNCGIALATDA